MQKSEVEGTGDDDEIVRVEGVSRIFHRGTDREVRAVDDVTMSVSRGCFAAVTGPSGSGKSSLLNLMGTLDIPDEGKVKVRGREVNYRDSGSVNGFRINYLGFVFQTFNLIPVLTALENVTMPLWVTKMGLKESRERGAWILEKVGLGDRMHHRPGALSGGQQQRVAVARALVRKPLLVLADEPTANLDTKSAFQVIDLMKGLHEEEGVSFLFSTHDDRVLQECADIRRLVDGRWVV